MREPDEKWLGDPDDEPVRDLEVASTIQDDPFHAGVRKHGQVPRRSVKMSESDIEVARRRMAGNTSRMAGREWLSNG